MLYDKNDSGLVCLRAAGAKPPLFCMHGGGGDPLVYEDLAASLPEDQPVYAFGLPVFDDKRQFPTVEQLASVYLAEVRKISETRSLSIVWTFVRWPRRL